MVELDSKPHLMSECCVAQRIEMYCSSASGGLRFQSAGCLAFEHNLGLRIQFSIC